MQNSFKILTLLSFVLLTSCLKQTESITPLAPVQTMAQIQREAMMSTALTAGNSQTSEASKVTIQESTDSSLFYLNLKYNIKDMDVFETADIPNSFEKLSNSFLKALAKLFLRIKGSQTIEIDPIELDLPNMNLDFDIVKSIRVKRIFLEYNKDYDQSTGGKANFSFVGSLNVNRVGKNKSRLFSYAKKGNNCNYKCLDFTMDDGNVFDLLKNNSDSIIVKPSLSIVSLPKVTELRLDGQVELQIGLKLPF